MQWDVFCRVIDNFGDLGVCWRLARDLAARGERVRLWVDDGSALRWMAPEVDAHGGGHPGVTVHPWPSSSENPWASLPPSQAMVEAFGCDVPPACLASAHRQPAPAWVNLEYLSAESYVERSHGLPSPVFHGPGAGLTKRFFYPGFTPRTGGLLREPGLLKQRDLAKRPVARHAWLASQRVNWREGDRVVSLFCYAASPMAPFLDALASAQAWRRPDAGSVHVLLTPGHATEQALAWAAAQHPPTPLKLHPLPPLPQPEFDRLLWASDLNLVRGEDSAVRALWAAQPHLWQVYRQHDQVHVGKLRAFMARWMHDWPLELSGPVQRLWEAWNGLPGGGDFADLHALWADPLWGRWRAASEASAQVLSRQDDLCTQLFQFVRASG